MGFWQFATGGGSGGGTGDVVGPASSTDNAVARWDLATGKLLQNSAVTIADTTGYITVPASSGITAASDDWITFGGGASGTGDKRFANYQGVLSFGSSHAIAWKNVVDANGGANDTGLARSAAGVVKVTDGSTGNGALLVGTAYNAVTGLKLDNGSGHGAALYGRNSGVLGFANLAGTVRRMELSDGALSIASDYLIYWTGEAKNAATSTVDLGLARIAAGQLAVQNAASGMANNIKIATTTVNASGATSTATNLVPAGCILLGVTTRVTTAITSGDGGTSVNIGNGTDVDMYGATIAFALGTTTNLASHTASALAWKSAAESVVFTCVGGTFATGQWRVCAHYLDLTAPTS